MTMIPHSQKHPQDRHFRLRAMTMFIGESNDIFDDNVNLMTPLMIMMMMTMIIIIVPS